MNSSTIIQRLRYPVCIALAVSVTACDYSTEVKKSVRRVLKEDFRNYHFFATPAGTFGAGTMYLKSANAQKPSEIGDEALIALPETYFAKDVPQAERDQLLKKIFPDGKIGKFSVNEKIVRGIDLDVAVPGIAGVLNAGGNVNLKKGVEVELQAGETAVRKLLWLELARARNEKKLADDIVQHLDARDVMIAMNDIVIRGYTAVVKVNTSANAAIKAELDKAAQGGAVSLPSGTAKFSSGQEGTYRIEISDPVVVAILFKEIPVGALAAGDTDTWAPATVSADVVSRLREIVMRRRAAIR